MSGAGNWQSLGAGGLYGSLTSTGGGGSTNVGTARDALDLRRMGSSNPHGDAYPAGYLGTQPGQGGRREDRIVAGVDGQHRSDQRGVHKGERIPVEDYVWPLDMRPDRGLRAIARGTKTPLVGAEPVHLVNSGKGRPIAPTPSMPDPYRAQQMAAMLPPWR